MTIPNITSITPASGPVSGGSLVTLFGSGLSSANVPGDILFGATPAASINSITDTALTVVSPEVSSAGVVTLKVTTPNGSASWDDGFNYTNDVSITSILPASGPVAGGTTLTIAGVGFLQVFSIQFDSTPAPTMIVASDTQLTVAAPPAALPGPADISLLGLTGDTLYVEFGGFTYASTPAATTSATTSGGSATTSGGSATTSSSTTSATTSGSPTSSTSSTATPTPTPSPSPTAGGPANPTSGGSTASATSSGGPSAAPSTTVPGGGTATPPAAAQPPAASTSAGSASTPQPGNYIPGGRMIVPGGQTGLGGSAGTGAGFGVGTLIPGGGGSAPPSNLPYYIDPGLTGQLVQTLIGLVQNASSPNAIEAQNMILRRMALEGDVIGSRIPPPRNISEIGGYINLLGTLQETAMREQALAGILGVAGPAM